jgi:hypothetical protein
VRQQLHAQITAQIADDAHGRLTHLILVKIPQANKEYGLQRVNVFDEFLAQDF